MQHNGDDSLKNASSFLKAPEFRQQAVPLATTKTCIYTQNNAISYP
jgi:hypothetical protein